MLSGLTKFVKIILPKSLFYRSLIIVAAPIIILQLIVSVVFFDSIWIKANKGMTRSLVSEIKTLVDVYKDTDKSQIEYISNIYKNNSDFVINIINEKRFDNSFERKFSPMDRSLRRELKSTFGSENYWFNTSDYLDVVEVKIRSDDKVLQFFFPREKIATSSVRLFILWLTVPSIILILIAILFLKNQTKPIVKLAKAAEKFGKGDYVNEFKTSGALEIRKASYEFDRMAKRINRHLNQRSEMLSGISHDLRTPLTRLKLQIAMLNQKEVSKSMSNDVDEMEKMLNDYLEFSKTQSTEETVKVNVSNLLDKIRLNINDEKLIINKNQDLYLHGRPNSLKRCFENVILNGLNYGEKVIVNTNSFTNLMIITFEDDGPGIPPDQYKNVFKPFFRLDKSRSLNKSSVGLGLSIVEDIVNSHGGNIQLSKSKFGGLKVRISLPF
ncbi:MAG: two-component sensor histidine kinase [Candidatus Pelagibacter sp.]|nr:two-component sensor histidine kinase [Candidatus Pelagibacter sp.]OUW24556.1 MAG: two-component sensor histidine kinase [Rickettsiales bacterium TMED174]